MTRNSQLSTTEPKQTNKQKNPKLRKQTKPNLQNKNRTTEMEITWRVINRGQGRGERGKGTENKQHKWQVENRQGEVKNNMGNGEAKELICTIHGHELMWGKFQCGGGYRTGGNKGEKKMGQL